MVNMHTNHYYGENKQDGDDRSQSKVTEDGGIGRGAEGIGYGALVIDIGRGHVVRLAVHRRPAFLGRCQVVALAGILVAAAAVVVRTRSATRHALRILPVQVKRKRARRTAERARAGAGPTRRMARLAELRRRIVVLRPGALGAQAVLEHEVRRARRALQRTFTCEHQKRC